MFFTKHISLAYFCCTESVLISLQLCSGYCAMSLTDIFLPLSSSIKNMSVVLSQTFLCDRANTYVE